MSSGCRKCPPGTKHLSKCSPGENGVCIPCEQNTFRDEEHTSTQCQRCSTKCGKSYQIIIQPCTAEHNIVCQCKAGHFLRSSFDLVCEKHTTCPPGEGVSIPGTPDSDTVCKPCEEGTFSASDSATERCVPHTSCGLHEVSTPGNLYSDNVCKTSHSTGILLAVTLSIALAVVIIILILVIRYLHRNGVRCAAVSSRINCALSRKQQVTGSNNLGSRYDNTDTGSMISQANIRQGEVTPTAPSLDIIGDDDPEKELNTPSNMASNGCRTSTADVGTPLLSHHDETSVLPMPRLSLPLTNHRPPPHSHSAGSLPHPRHKSQEQGKRASIHKTTSHPA